MNAGEARAILAMILGYWSTPPATEEEAAAWLRELAGSPMRITFGEARTVIDDMVRAGGRFRPRPGEVVAAVQGLRRHRRLMTTQPALPEAPVGFEADPEGFLDGVASAKRALRAPRPATSTRPPTSVYSSSTDTERPAATTAP
jgi:hypothetical protein